MEGSPETNTKLTDAEFKDFVKSKVKKVASTFFVQLEQDGLEIGLREVLRVNRKQSIIRLINWIIKGDKGRHYTDANNAQKMEAFVKRYLFDKYVVVNG